MEVWEKTRWKDAPTTHSSPKTEVEKAIVRELENQMVSTFEEIKEEMRKHICKMFHKLKGDLTKQMKDFVKYSTNLKKK